MSAVEDRKLVEELLPFWVNGTLAEDEAAFVESEVARDAGLASDAGILNRLREQIKSDELANSPGEFGLARLMRDVELEGKSSAANSRFAPAIWGALAASVVAVAFVMSGLFDSNDPTFEQASGDIAGGSVSVIFQPELAAEDLSLAIYDLGLVIVDGPSALGVYQLAPIEAVDLVQVSADLNRRSDLFEYVEIVE